MAKKRDIKPGGVSEYIAACPKNVQPVLKSMRSAVRSVTPKGTIETVSYFRLPGYHYPGDYAYNGMFAWFSYKKPYVRLHIWPQVIQDHKKELAGYPTKTGAICFPEDKKIPVALVKKLVKASIREMKDRA